MADVEVRVRNTANTTGTTTLSNAYDVRFQIVPNGKGTGSFKLANGDVGSIGAGTVVQFLLGGTPQMSARVKSTVPTLVSVNDEDIEGTLFVCERLQAHAFEKSVVHPPPGVVSIDPPIDERRMAWYGPDYDPTPDGWTTATVISSQGWSADWWVGQPSGWDDPDADWIWGPSGTVAEADVGFCLFRKVVGVTAGPLSLTWSGDNLAAAYINGQRVGVQGDFRQKQVYDFTAMETGNLLLCFTGENSGGPAGVIWSLRAGREGAVIARSGSDTSVLEIGLGAAPPVYLGKMVEAATEGNDLAEAWGRTFTEYLDSDGEPFDWPGDLALRIGDTVDSVIKQFTDIYVDRSISVSGTDFGLVNKGTLQTTSSLVLEYGTTDANLTDLQWDVVPAEFTALRVRCEDGWFTRPASPPTDAVWGTLELGQQSRAVAQDIADGMLTLYGVDQLTASFTLLPNDSSEWPFTAFDEWSLLNVPDPDGGTTAQKVASITVQGDEDGDAEFLVEVGSLVEDRIAWLERAVARNAPSLGGRAAAAAGSVKAPAAPSLRVADGVQQLFGTLAGQSIGDLTAGPTRIQRPARVDRLVMQGDETDAIGDTVAVVKLNGTTVATLTLTTSVGRDVALIGDTWLTTDQITADCTDGGHVNVALFAETSEVVGY